MDRNWNSAGELAHFREIWDYRSPNHKTVHTKQLWDERADEWENELVNDVMRSESTRKRIEATVEYLRSRGLLAADHDVVDVGCGPGRFVGAFAEHCRTVTGTDLSDRMLEYGAAHAESLALNNTKWTQADFNTVDLDALGWRNRFDLVFTSITPAVGGSKNLQKLMDMSRGWCFNSCFVYAEDDLLNHFFVHELDMPPKNKVEGHWHWFYGLFNLLLLEGYYPETRYYDEVRTEHIRVTPEAARHLCRGVRPPEGMSDEQLCDGLYRFMQARADEHGFVTRNDTCTYGWILWDVRRRNIR